MWNQIEHYFDAYPQRKRIAQKMLEYGIKIQKNNFYCGSIELADSKIARAFHVDRRAVTATRDVIIKEPKLLKIFSNLAPTCRLKEVAPAMKWGIIEIIPADPSMPGILADVATIIATNNISIRQAIVDDFELTEEPRLFIITEKQIPGSLLSAIRDARGVKAVLIY
jgi:predicted regulator of amino acid metabolism with ACT domain